MYKRRSPPFQAAAPPPSDKLKANPLSSKARSFFLLFTLLGGAFFFALSAFGLTTALPEAAAAARLAALLTLAQSAF